MSRALDSWLLVLLPAGVIATRLVLPRLYASSVRRFMMHKSSTAWPVPSTEVRQSALPFDATGLIAASARTARLSRLVLLAGVIAQAWIHLDFVEPNTVAGRPDVTPAALALLTAMLLPFVFAPAAMRVGTAGQVVSFWFHSLLIGLQIGAATWVAISLLGDGASFGLVLLSTLLGVLFGYVLAIAVLALSSIAAAALDASPLTTGVVLAYAFSSVLYVAFEWNAVRSGAPVVLLLPVAAVAVLLVAIGRRASPAGDAPRMLLVLRTFGHEARSRRLLDQLAPRWLAVGPVCLVVGPDVATVTLRLADLLAFLIGRLRSRFIATPVDAQRALELSTRRLRDGRYPLASFSCIDSSWRAVVTMLVDRSDYVLMDLRAFSRNNQGCVYELEELVRIRALRQALLIVDAGSDRDQIATVVRDAADRHGVVLAPELPLLSLDDRTLSMPTLLSALSSCAAAERRP